MLNLGTQIKWALGLVMTRPVSPVSLSSGVQSALVIFLQLVLVLLIPGGILAVAYWWFRQNRGLNPRQPALDLIPCRQTRPGRIR